MALDPRISYSNHILTVEKLAHLVGASAKAGRSESFASSLGCSSKHGQLAGEEAVKTENFWAHGSRGIHDVKTFPPSI